ncbi:MAG: Cell division protein FtsL [Mycoplasmataceae bacterium]|nr:MAG: Cell division protein FtsL [Mycoplasmataceae bacterium]
MLKLLLKKQCLEERKNSLINQILLGNFFSLSANISSLNFFCLKKEEKEFRIFFAIIIFASLVLMLFNSFRFIGYYYQIPRLQKKINEIEKQIISELSK